MQARYGSFSFFLEMYQTRDDCMEDCVVVVDSACVGLAIIDGSKRSSNNLSQKRMLGIYCLA